MSNNELIKTIESVLFNLNESEETLHDYMKDFDSNLVIVVDTLKQLDDIKNLPDLIQRFIDSNLYKDVLEEIITDTTPYNNIACLLEDEEDSVFSKEQLKINKLILQNIIDSKPVTSDIFSKVCESDLQLHSLLTLVIGYLDDIARIRQAI